MKKSSLALLATLFLLSGLTGLVYENLWARVLALSVGSTAEAVSMVVSIFFLGLAGGSFWAGRVSGKFRQPLLSYSVIQLSIGLYALGILPALFAFQDLMLFLAGPESSALFTTCLKFALVTLFLLPPSLGMGATLPLITRFLENRVVHPGRALSLLYGVNNLGAVLGAFGAGFALIPQLGLLWGNTLIAGLSLFIGAGAVRLNREVRTFHDPVVVVTDDETPDRWSASDVFRLAALALCGFCAFAAHVVWSKYLGIFFGMNIFGLGLLLALFLLGLSLGALLLSTHIDTVRSREQLFVVLLWSAGLLVLLSAFFMNVVPVLSHLAGHYWGESFPLLAIKVLFGAALILPPTMAFGAIVPLGTLLLHNPQRRLSMITGLAHAFTILGSVAGANLACLLLIPRTGSAVTLQISVVGFLAAGLMALVTAAFWRQQPRWPWILCGVLLLILATARPVLNYRYLVQSAYLQANRGDLTLPEVLTFFSKDFEDFVMIYEGKSSVISLSHDPGDGRDSKHLLRFKSNGLVDAVYNTSDPRVLPKYEALLGYLPYLFAPHPQSAFLIGLDSGATADLLTGLGLPKVHVVEAEDGVVKAVQLARQGTSPVLQRQNLKLSVDDPRVVLSLRQGDPYDMIVSQPSHAWQASSAPLFTLEFFRIVRNNLKSRGVFAQGLNLYNMDEAVLKSLLRTFFEVFPDGAVFSSPRDNQMILLGSPSALEFDPGKLQSHLRNSQLREQLRLVPFNSPADLLSNHWGRRQEVLSWVADSPLNTDVNAYVEVRQSQLSYSARPPGHAAQRLLARHFPANFDIYAKPGRAADELTLQILKSLSNQGCLQKFVRVLESFEDRHTSALLDNETLANFYLKARRYASVERFTDRMMRSKPSASLLKTRVDAFLESQRPTEALSALQRYQPLWDARIECQAVELYSRGLAPSSWAFLPARVEANSRIYRQKCGDQIDKILGLWSLRSGRPLQALKHFERYHLNGPQDLASEQLLLQGLLAAEQSGRAVHSAHRFHESVKSERERLQELADFYHDRGEDDDALLLQNMIRRLETTTESVSISSE